MSRFSYQPIRGELSGASFEAQTTAFFESLANEMGENATALNQALARLQMLVDANIAAIEANANAIRAMQATLAAQAAKIASLETAINGLQIAIDDLQGRIPPNGLIGLIYDQPVPQGWDECDGANGTPDLSGMVKTPLKYIRKNILPGQAS